MSRPLALLVLLCASPLAAQVDPIVRLEVRPDAVRVGEALALRVTVLVPTWFPRPPLYPDFEVANAITRLPPDSSYPTSERIDGESWSGIVREYRIYPLAAGSYRIDGASMRVTYASPGAEPLVRDVALPPVVFRGTVPAGAEALDPYLAGRELKLSLDVQREEGAEGDLAVGDAVVLSYTAALDGLPSMFLPPLAPALDAPVGAGTVSVYADAARFEDGDPLATRSERVTIVFQAGGEFTVPAVAIDYWDTQAGAVRTARTEALKFTVSGPAQPAAAVGDAVADRRPWQAVVLAAVLVALLAITGRVLLPRSRQWALAWREPEPRAFRELRRTLRSDDEEQHYAALQRWLASLDPGLSPRAFARAWGDQGLGEAVDALSAHCFGGAGDAPDPRRLAHGLGKARRRYHHARRRRRGGAIVPLNP
ncbi:BatD family protein [Pseudohaliea sp.]|uniref:BatD family protein n=1 Tax=Pseudohaliea sp. TaxID=2740289 RepID=UPI0032ED7FC0